MPSALPDGEPAPPDGALPAQALEGLGTRPFGVYLHVPFCAVRCGYCDFNTYTATELGGGASQASYAATAARELDLAADVLAAGDGGLACLPAWTRCSSAAARRPCCRSATWSGSARRRPRAVRPGAGRRGHDRGQPRLGDPGLAGRARRGRASPGSRSACSRRCRACWPPSTAPTTRSGCPQAVGWARAAGLAVSLDLIYGTPGESVADWAASLDGGPGLRAGPPVGVRAGRRGGHQAGRPGGARRAARCPRTTTRRRSTSWPTPRSTAAGLELVRDQQLGPHAGPTPAGTTWATGGTATGGASGPGAHSHVGGVRWWNVKHPTRVRRAPGRRAASPAQAREVLTPTQRRGRAGPARRPAGRGPAGRRRCPDRRRGVAGADRRRAGRRRRGRSGAGWCSPCAAACWPTRWSRRCWPSG